MSKAAPPLWIIVLFLFVLAGCASPTAFPPSPVQELVVSSLPPISPSPTETLPATQTPTQTPSPTDTPTVIPSATPAPVDTETPTPTASPTPPLPIGAGAFASVSEGTVRIYFIRLKTGGTTGCGDSLVAMSSGVRISGDIAEDVAAGLERLFALKDKFIGDLYNPLYASSIRVEKVDFDSRSGLIAVYLRGTYKPSGDDCDHTRVKAQVWSTIRQFRGVERTNIYLNGIPFGDRVSNDK